ncbi:MAG: glycerol-3-phosphate responsive antiterminator [Candidatus Atribacteria bacterium]|nr:glycerol-3-phosphate responsive antiterminator [Candidatus Atribacteria bacterium]
MDKSLDFLTVLKHFPIIGAIRVSREKNLHRADLRYCRIFFLLDGNINDLPDVLNQFDEQSQIIFLHLDLFSGLAPDPEGLLFLKKNFPLLNGVISTRTRTLSVAKKVGFLTVFRLFLLDSESLQTGLKIASSVAPEALEVLPGIIFPAVHRLLPVTDLPPLICGGFIREKEEVQKIFTAGASAISSSSKELWKLNIDYAAGVGAISN